VAVPALAQPLPLAGVPASGVDEVQRVTITGGPTGGSITLTYAGQTTAAIPYNATAAQVQAALEALAAIAAGDVACSGGPFPTTAIDVRFQNDLGGLNLTEMTAASALTGGVSPAVAVSTVTPGVRGSYRGARYGQLLCDTTNGVLYEQTSLSPATPTWSEVEP